MIEARELTRKYGDFTAVNSVSFSITRGEIVGLLGHNGAGKTTIMKMITGFLEPNAGNVLIDGLDMEEHRLTIQEKIGYLPENCPLYPEMTVIDYLEFVARLRGVPEESCAAAVREAIERTALKEKATAPINTLSRGYRQRVGVAQAIIHRPEILILDEPTNGLDPSQIEEMRSLIRSLSESSTIILSTHILQEVQAVCDRVIIILQGRVALDSKLKDLQASNRVMLSTDGKPDDVRRRLQTLREIREVAHLGARDGRNEFVLEVERNGKDVTPAIAKMVIDEGYNLYAFHPERRDLETVFREINSGTQEGSHE